MHSRSAICLALSLVLLFPACSFQYGMAVPGYGYPAGLSVLAPRFGRSGNYTYYPRYEAYYHHDSKQFHYPNGKNWEVKPTVLNNSAQEIRSTPGVPFQLDAPPSNYHAQIKQGFPLTWTPGKGRFDDPYEFGHSGWELDNR